MTAAYRLKGAGWLIACVAVILGFYLVSLRVAAERKKLEQLDARIALAQRDIRALETEFDTRANLAQLERWNGDTLALAAPTAGQFVASGAALAAIDVAAPGPAAVTGAGAVRAAALVVPSAVAPAAPTLAQTMTAQTMTAPPATRTTPAPAPALAAAGVVRVAAIHPAPSAEASRSFARLTDTGRARAAVRPRTVALLDGKLLSDATLGDLLAQAKHESSERGARKP